MRSKNLLLGGGLVVVCVVIGGASFRGSEVRSIDFARVRQIGAQQVVQVYGKLDARSVKPDAERGANLVSFTLLDEKTKEPLDVVYDNVQIPLPANFPAASHARATGTWNAALGKFVANSVQTKCPSKYEEERLPIDTREAVEQFRKATGQQASAQ